MHELNPYLSPAAVSEPAAHSAGRIGGVLAEAWRLFRRHWIVIVVAGTCVWLPLELLDSYVHYYVYDPEDFSKAGRFSRGLDDCFGIVAVAAITSAGAKSTAGGKPTIAGVLASGLGAWARIFWTRFLTRFAIALCLLLLIVPGIYVAIRLSLAETACVVEVLSGTDAIQRSFALTRNHFWRVFLLNAVLIMLLALCLLVAVVPVGFVGHFIPILDNWIVYALSALLANLGSAYVTLCYYCALRQLATEAPSVADAFGQFSSLLPTRENAR